MNDAAPIVDAQAVMRNMLATPRITQDYWKEADALELAYINTKIEPDLPERMLPLDEDQTFTAAELRRGRNGLEVWWCLDPERDPWNGFWTDIDGRLLEDAD